MRLTARLLWIAAPVVAVVALGTGAAASPSPSARPLDARPPTLATAPDPMAQVPLFVEWNGSFWPARVLARVDDRRVAIHYEGWGSEWDEIVGHERLAIELASSARPFRAGDEIYVEWNGSYWPATVRSVAAGRVAIHYEGWGNEWDETVGPERVRRLRLVATPRAAAGLLAVGKAVEVRWGGRWWPATITAVFAGNRARIHYEGWGNEWDETVGPGRVRPRS